MDISIITKLPLPNSRMGVAHYQDIIYLIGGYLFDRINQIQSIHKTLHTIDLFQCNIICCQSRWFQMNNVYMAMSSEGIIRTYDLVMNQLNDNYSTAVSDGGNTFV